jgi:DNA-binding MarR family transcriptional regulator
MPVTEPRKPQDRRLVKDILKLSDDIFHATGLSVPAEWLSSNLTVAQLRVMLFLRTEGPNRMGSIAADIGTTLPTVTGTVELLVKKGLVERRADPEDRRLVICELTPRGAKLMRLVWDLGRKQIASLLTGLDREQLEKVREVAGLLLRNVTGASGPPPASP